MKRTAHLAAGAAVLMAVACTDITAVGDVPPADSAERFPEALAADASLIALAARDVADRLASALPVERATTLHDVSGALAYALEQGSVEGSRVALERLHALVGGLTDDTTHPADHAAITLMLDQVDGLLAGRVLTRGE